MNAERRCINCGEILPPLRWWQRNWLLEPPRFHDFAGADGPSCWRGMMRRLGLSEDIPPP